MPQCSKGDRSYAATTFSTVVGQMQNYRRELSNNRDALLERALSNSAPIWRPITSRELASTFGVSMQTLANWRVRDNGPPYTASRRGTKCLYRVDEVLGWLTKTPSWELARAWMVRRGMAPADADKTYVDWVSTFF